MEELVQFINGDQLILVAACYCLGMVLKESLYIKDNFIPLILMLFSMVCNIWLFGFNAISFLQAIIVSFIAVGINSTYKQIEKYKTEK